MTIFNFNRAVVFCTAQILFFVEKREARGPTLLALSRQGV